MDVSEAIKKYRSVKNFKPIPIPEEKLKLLLNAIRLANSIENLQPLKFILVRDEGTKRKLMSVCNNQKFIAEAPLIVVGCGLLNEATALVGRYMVSYPIDVAIALQNLSLACVDLGLGSCWVCDFNEEKVMEILGIPQDVKVVAIVPVGYPAEETSPESRKQLSEIISYEKYE
ncbi:MAG: nitroreductase family protein [Candidatus Thermoplasmatota archaeon]